MGGGEKKYYDLPTRPRPPVATLTRRSASRLAHHSDLAGHHHHHDKAVRCLVYSPATLPQMEEGEKEDMKKIRLTEKKKKKRTPQDLRGLGGPTSAGWYGTGMRHSDGAIDLVGSDS